MTFSTIKRQNKASTDKSIAIHPVELGRVEASPAEFFCSADLRAILDRISEQEEALLNAPVLEIPDDQDAAFFPDSLHPVSMPLLYAK